MRVRSYNIVIIYYIYIVIDTKPTDSRFITSKMCQLRKRIFCHPEIWTSTSPDRLFWQWSLRELVYHSEAKLSCWKILFKRVSSQTNTQSGWTLTTELINPDVESLTQPSLTLPVRKAHCCLCISTTCSVFQKRTNLTLFYKRERKDKLVHI